MEQAQPRDSLRRALTVPKTPSHRPPSSHHHHRLHTEPEQPAPLLKPFLGRQQIVTIHDTVKKIDGVLQVFSSKVRHANYLEEMKYTYIKRLDSMEKQINTLKLEKKIREMERSEKETIDQLIKKNQEYREESDRLFVLVCEIRKRVGEMDKYIKTLIKENQKLRNQNVNLMKTAKITEIKEHQMKKMTLTETIDNFLKEKNNQQTVIYNFIKDNQQIPEQDFLLQLGRFVDSLISLPHHKHKSRSPQRLPTLSSNRTPRISSRHKLYSQHRLKKSPVLDIFS